jgi:hypothetical protein
MRLRFPFFFLLGCPAVRAQGLEISAITLKKYAQSVESYLPQLNQKADIVVAITIALIVMGAVTAAVALMLKERGKWVTALIGVGISILTGIKAEVYHANQESFESVSSAASLALEKTYTDLTSYDTAVSMHHPATADNAATREYESALAADFASDRKALEDIAPRAAKLGVRFERKAEINSWLRLPHLPLVNAAAQASRVPSWISKPRSRPDAFVVIGTGSCSTPIAAREFSRYDARRRLALQLEPGATPERLDVIIAAIDTSVDDQTNYLANYGTGVVTNYTEASLNRAFRPATAVAKTRPERRFLAFASVNPSFRGELIARTSKGKDVEGDFEFVFQVDSTSKPAAIRLNEIRVIDDSSAGSTRWSFDVWAEGRRIFAVPMRRYSDSGHPSLCRVLSDELLEGQFSASGKLSQIQVFGYKPKDY